MRKYLKTSKVRGCGNISPQFQKKSLSKKNDGKKESVFIVRVVPNY